MAKTDFKSMDEYIGTFPVPVQNVLKQVRMAIREAVPGAEETISYQIPAFKFHGWLFYFSAYASHYSLSCPPPSDVFDAFKKELAPYKISKSAIKFPLDHPVPVGLIRDMARFRAKQNLEHHQAKKK